MPPAPTSPVSTSVTLVLTPITYGPAEVYAPCSERPDNPGKLLAASIQSGTHASFVRAQDL